MILTHFGNWLFFILAEMPDVAFRFIKNFSNFEEKINFEFMSFLKKNATI